MANKTEVQRDALAAELVTYARAIQHALDVAPSLGPSFERMGIDLDRVRRMANHENERVKAHGVIHYKFMISGRIACRRRGVVEFAEAAETQRVTCKSCLRRMYGKA